MSRIELVVLDIAGTLVDDGGAVLDAYRAALNSEAIPFAETDLQAARGGNKRAMIAALAQKGLGANGVAAGARAYAAFESLLLDGYREGALAPFPGVEAALGEISEMSVKLATNTGFPAALAALVLERLGWRPGPFATNVCGDEVPEGRPAPYMIQLAMQRAGVQTASRVLVAGDTPLDLQAGTNAGAGGVVGVLTGSHGVETLGAVRHTHLLSSVAALPALLRSEFGC